ncbi:MAG: hypothetical protein ACYDGR_12755 [Candidatus Dormibacteria bacterium]
MSTDPVAQLMEQAVATVGGVDTPLGHIAWVLVKESMREEHGVKEGSWVVDDALRVVGIDGRNTASERQLIRHAMQQPPAMAYRLVRGRTATTTTLELHALSGREHLAFVLTLDGRAVDLKWVRDAAPIVVARLQPLLLGAASKN